MTEERSTKAFKVKITKNRVLVEEGKIIAPDEKTAMEMVKEGKVRLNHEYCEADMFVSENQVIEITE